MSYQLAPAPFAAISNFTSGNGAVRTYNVTTPTRAGDTLLLLVEYNQLAYAISSITDSQGNVYTLDASYTTAVPVLLAYRSPGNSGGPGPGGSPTVALGTSDTLTINGNTIGTFVGVQLIDVTGSVDVVSAIASGTSGTASVNITPANDQETLIAAFAVHQNATAAPVAVAPWTGLGAAGPGTGPWGASEYLQPDSGNAGVVQTASMTLTAPAAWRGVAWAFLPVYVPDVVAPPADVAPMITQAPTIQIGYEDPDGNYWGLSDLLLNEGYICTSIDGISGLPVNLTSIPLVNGTAQPALYLPQPGVINIGIYLEAPNGDLDAFYALVDKFTYAFFNLRNNFPAPGKLIIARPNGTVRRINVFTTSGLESPDFGAYYANYALSLQTLDPFWEDLDPEVLTYSTRVPAAGILPLLPIAIGASNVLGQSVLNNDGGADAYPFWDIFGPGIPTITNVTTGRQFSFATTLSPGDHVQVETRPGKQLVYRVNGGVNFWSQIVAQSPRDLWSIPKGVNVVNLGMSGSGLASSVQLTWTRRWLRA